jgi:phospholipase C
MAIDRRLFLHGLAGTSGLALLDPGGAAAGFRPLPRPEESGIAHIVVVMMENRSFDHLLGWLPGARGRQAGLLYADRDGRIRMTHPLRPDRTGCGHPDPSHSWEGGREQWNGGLMDGFLRSGANDEYAIGYYREADRPFTGQLARHYTTCDRYHCAILGPTFPNRIFQHAGQTDRITNSFERADLTTIWDRLAAAGVSRRYYYSNLPFIALLGRRHRAISRLFGEFLRDAAAGTLPAVSFVDPRFTLLPNASFGNDDHPHADIARGDAFLSRVFHALADGPGWPGTVLVVNYDEWGGFFDHVPPPRRVAPNEADPDLENGKALLGFRVPCVVASPFSRGRWWSPRISRLTYDHTSVLKLIGWRHRLPPLTARDASMPNLAWALDFRDPDPRVPALPRPIAPLPSVCTAAESASAAAAVAAGREGDSEAGDLWTGFRNAGVAEGWPVAP